jgi:cyclic pyranopterin phosphate synthase
MKLPVANTGITAGNIPGGHLVDRYNRHLNYLRISITDRCNLQCLYCSPDDRQAKLPHAEILTYEEILRVVKVGVRLGISKLRITGGEPLVRKGVYGFLQTLSQIRGVAELSLTTNGVFLCDHLEEIKSAGIRRINVSLDTLNPAKFKKITRRDLFERVWEAIRQAHRKGFAPIKINVVALRGINDDELEDFGRLSFDYPFHIRFIEFMPIGGLCRHSGKRMLAPEIRDRLSALGDLVALDKAANDGPAQRFKFTGARGEIGFIRPISRHFCSTCNRLRLTASGQLRACLLSDRQDDLKGLLRRGCSDDDLAEIFFRAVSHKPFKHQLTSGPHAAVCTRMSAIGG